MARTAGASPDFFRHVRFADRVLSGTQAAAPICIAGPPIVQFLRLALVHTGLLPDTSTNYRLAPGLPVPRRDDTGQRLREWWLSPPVAYQDSLSITPSNRIPPVTPAPTSLSLGLLGSPAVGRLPKRGAPRAQKVRKNPGTRLRLAVSPRAERPARSVPGFFSPSRARRARLSAWYPPALLYSKTLTI
jgi:hypothetical protein